MTTIAYVAIALALSALVCWSIDEYATRIAGRKLYRRMLEEQLELTRRQRSRELNHRIAAGYARRDPLTEEQIIERAETRSRDLLAQAGRQGKAPASVPRVGDRIGASMNAGRAVPRSPEQIFLPNLESAEVEKENLQEEERCKPKCRQ